MKDSETIKEYLDKLLGIVNKVRLLGTDFSDCRIVEKILVTVPERYEASITTLENTKDLSKIILAKLINALQAQEQRMLMRQDRIFEGALPAKHQEYGKKKYFKKYQLSSNENTASNINQSKAVICKNKFQIREADAQVADQDDEDQMFVATCFSTRSSSECCLIDSGCTNHMTFDITLFKDLQSTEISKVRIGNGDYISAKGKGTIAIATNSGTKTISDVLYVPDIDQNLLSVGQLIEKGFKVTFEDQCCLIYDAAGQKILQIKMREVAGVFWKFKKMVENQSGCKIQSIRSDNGKEYTSAEFNLVCKEAGIEHQLTAPYILEQNGVSERRNRYVMEMTRCMLLEKELPKEFWAEAANTTVFLQNRLPAKFLEDKTPFEVKRDKIDKKAVPGIFVGYSSVSKAYKWQNEQEDEPPIRGTKLLSDIYQRCNVAIYEPAGYEEALKDFKWKKTMEEEMSMIQKNKTWDLVDRPEGRKVIGEKWIFKTKFNADNSINKYKARLVVKGLDTIRLLLVIAAQKGWKVFQLDVKSTFLNGVLQEEIYVKQPDGFAIQGEEDKVYLLQKALYELKQAPRAWYSRIDDHLLNLGFVKSLSKATLYIRLKDDDILIMSLYVDDLLITGSNELQIEEFKQEMMRVFEMTDLGLMTYFLGMEVKQSKNEVFICQKKYAKEILKKFQMEECKATSTPMNQKEKLCKDDGAHKIDEGYFRSIIGCLMYLTTTRPAILFDVSLLSRFMHRASELHLRAAKRILRYVRGTVSFGVKYEKCKSFKLHGFSDSDWAVTIEDMKSTSGYCFTLGS
ncbi:uncharacterized protein LOC112324164 [Populus trichocarpa]|uniref:uncharacterized protein LOC112324164 n=1 Tax=Populus trichocarpa TaxID=3694 RepID=UPI000D187E33|nr:uncharacterized protein LOC112324164 [Populus trichocarpa]|eukprot:XP_024441578.1 uncharacterized protein LOC112324164 [Populus trichocarpa]